MRKASKNHHMLCLEILVREQNSIIQEEAADENMYPTKIIKTKSNIYLNFKKLSSRDPGNTNAQILSDQYQESKYIAHLLWR